MDFAAAKPADRRCERPHANLGAGSLVKTPGPPNVGGPGPEAYFLLSGVLCTCFQVLPGELVGGAGLLSGTVT
jgi:hypothetical protein